MTDETHVDGNALGGMFQDIFGREMTEERGCCDHCGTVSSLGALIVYRAAGEVLRCPACSTVVMVVVALPGELRVSFTSLRWLEVSDSGRNGVPA